MNTSTRMRWLVTALAVAVVGAPTAPAAGPGTSPYPPDFRAPGVVLSPAERGYSPHLTYPGEGFTGTTMGPTWQLPEGFRAPGVLPANLRPAPEVKATPQVRSPAAPASGFDFADAGVGFGIATAITLLAAAATAALRRRRPAHL